MLELVSDNTARDWELELPDGSVLYGKQDSTRVIFITNYVTPDVHMEFINGMYSRHFTDKIPDVYLPAAVKVRGGNMTYYSIVGHGLRCEVVTDLQRIGFILDGANVLLVEQLISLKEDESLMETDKRLADELKATERGKIYIEVLREHIQNTPAFQG